MILLLWASIATVACLAASLYWHIACMDIEDLHCRFMSTCDKAKKANDRATEVIGEFDKLESQYLERCKELRELRRKVSESILSLAEAAKDTSGDIS